jgi:shikimate dehydrogenase
MDQSAHTSHDAPAQYAVIGNPIVQSKSPIIHTQFARTTGQHLVYSKIEGQLGKDGFKTSVDAFRANGGRGMNVTAPFKLDAFAYATQASERAKQAGAVNALKFEGDEVFAENFDGIGLVRDIEKNFNRPLKDLRILLLGAGGAVRGAIMPILEKQPLCLVIANRTVVKAQALAQQYRLVNGLHHNISASSLDAVQKQTFDVVLNATSASLSAELPGISPKVFTPYTLAYELAYGKGLTPFLQLAKSTGVTQLADGVGMLVEQAAEAFFWWRGVRPNTDDAIRELTIPLR